MLGLLESEWLYCTTETWASQMVLREPDRNSTGGRWALPHFTFPDSPLFQLCHLLAFFHVIPFLHLCACDYAGPSVWNCCLLCSPPAPFKDLTILPTLLCFRSQPACMFWTAWGAITLQPFSCFRVLTELLSLFLSSFLSSSWPPQTIVQNLPQASPLPESFPWSLIPVQKTLLWAPLVPPRAYVMSTYSTLQ